MEINDLARYSQMTNVSSSAQFTLMPSLYFDYHASTPIDPIVIERMSAALRENYGNPHSDDHSYGWAAQKQTDTARKLVAQLICAEKDEIVFTSGATESNNLAILGLCRGIEKAAAHTKTKRQIIVGSVEHKCVLAAVAALGKRGWIIDHAPVDNSGLIDVNQLKTLMSENTAMVAIMAVNNEVGTIQPISEIGTLCREYGALFHCDAAQAPTALNVNCLLYTSPSPRDQRGSRMPSSA